ncbi:MAG: DUF4126 domain-containing protein [Candidatus Fermentibacteria bacterium]
METVVSILIGLGLSATCGFRIFVPLLVMSIMGHLGFLELSQGFSWIASTPALIAFSVAALAETLGYLIPFVDNALDAVTVPLTVVAGTVITAAVLLDLDPFLTWTLAVIAGGGSSLAGSAASNFLHWGSTTTTGGSANPILSAFESVFSVIMAVLSILIPLLAVMILALLLIFGIRLLRKLNLFRRKPISA